MFCTNCGAKLPDDAQFCTECGQRLDAANAPAPAATPNATPTADDAARVMAPGGRDGLDVPAEETMVMGGAAATTVTPPAEAPTFCTNCGAQVPAGCDFCIQCGAPVGGAPAGGGSSDTAQNVAIPSELLGSGAPEPPRRRNTGAIVAAVVALVLVLAGGSVVGLHYFGVLGDPAFLSFLPMREQPADDAEKDGEQSDKADAEKGSDKDAEEEGDAKDSKDKDSKDDKDDSDEQDSSDRQKSEDKGGDTSSSSNSSGSTSSGGGSSSSAGSTSASDDYVLPDSATRVYSTSELSGLSDWELYIARNEIYARHGRGFQNQDLRDYFAGKSWYHEQYSPEEFDSYVTLNSTEQQNADTILKLEQSRGSQYVS